jgi:hypothetical protein
VRLTAAGVVLLARHGGHLEATLAVTPTRLAARRQPLSLTRKRSG